MMKKVIFLCAVCLCAACSPIKPFVDARHEAGQQGTVGQSTLNHVAICYNPFLSDKTIIPELAQKECEKTNRHAVYEASRNFTCCLSAPATDFYNCQK